MTAAAAYAELASAVYRALERAMILVQAIDKPYRPLIRKILLLDSVRIALGLVPMVIKDAGNLLETRSLVILPCVVGMKNDLDIFIGGIKGIDRI